MIIIGNNSNNSKISSENKSCWSENNNGNVAATDKTKKSKKV